LTNHPTTTTTIPATNNEIASLLLDEALSHIPFRIDFSDPFCWRMVRRRRPPRSGALTELRPLKILSQIAALQIIYYVAATILILFTTLVSGTKFSLDLIFSWRDVRADAATGWVWGFIWLFDGGLVVYVLFYPCAPYPSFPG
jgi:hypothetical protein